MKRLISTGLLLSLITFGLPANSYAALDGCPSTWNIKLPELIIDKFSALSNGVNVHFYASSLFGPDNSSRAEKGMRYPLEVSSTQPIRRFNGEYSLKVILPEVYEKLNSLGKDAIWSSNYEVVGSSIRPSNINPNELNALFAIPVRSWLLYYLGIGNGTQIKYNLKISVKSCADFVTSSNTYRFNTLEKSIMTLDDFFKYSGDPSIGGFNFKQEEFIRSRLESNKKLISQGTLNQEILLNRIGEKELDGKEFGYLFLGTNPTACIESINPTSYPAANPVSVIVRASNCEISIVTTIRLTEQLNCKSNTCRVDARYGNLVSRLQINSYGGDWGYEGVEIGTLTVDLQKAQKNTSNSITCTKGKTTKKVSGTNPKCPKGYKKAS